MKCSSALPGMLFSLSVLLLAGCGSVNRLGEHQFDGRTLAVVAAIPPAPVVFSELLASAGVYPHHPYGRRVAYGGPARGEKRAVDRLEKRLRAAAKQVDVPAALAAETYKVVSERLGSTRVANPKAADYVLDVRVMSYGLHLRTARARGFLFVDAEVMLIERASSEVVWKEMMQNERLRVDALIDADPEDLTEEDLRYLLDAFANHLTDELATAFNKDYKG